ncbi:hypothetical protein ACLK15_10375 [Escherichia coli]
MTDTPGHHLTITALDEAIAFPVRFGQDVAMARARLGFSAINNRIELTNLKQSPPPRAGTSSPIAVSSMPNSAAVALTSFSANRQKFADRTADSHFTRHFTHQMTVAGKVTFSAARYCANLMYSSTPGSFRDRFIVDACLHTSPLTHFAQVAQQTESP